jgi:hypothetical protein
MSSMNIVYCEKCGLRIPDADVTSGAASSADEGRYICPGCTASKAPSKTSAGVSSRKDSTTVLPPPAKTRVLPTPRESGGGMGAAGIVGGIAAMVLLGVVVFMFSGGKPSLPRKSEPAKPSPPPLPPATPDPLKSSGGDAVLPPGQPGGERKQPEEEDTPRDMIARRELETIKAWGREHGDDPYGYADRLAGFLARNRTARPGQDAARLVAELKVPSRVNAPLAHWALDEGSGTSARDAAGTGAAILKGQIRFVTGRVGSGAVSFAGGREDYVDLGSDPKLNFGAGAPFTLAGWFRTSEPLATLLSFRNSSDESTDLDVAIGHHGASRNPGQLMAIVRQDGGRTNFGNVIGPTVNDGAWHHFALTRNTEGTIRLFLDGAYQGMHTNAESGGAITTDRRSCGLELLWTQAPQPPDATGQGLKGEMDDVRVYNCALTESELRELANMK